MNPRKSVFLDLSSHDKKTLLNLSHETLRNPFLPHPKSFFQIKSDFEPTSDRLTEPHPCFVTLTTEDDKLRGCVGCVWTTTSLIENVFEYTLLAASRDGRFEPVQPSEVSNLMIEISVLGPIIPMESISKVEMGRHGLYVRHHGFSGLLLAQVPVRYGWNSEEFLRQTCLKAGLDPSKSNEYEVFLFDEICFSDEEFGK